MTDLYLNPATNDIEIINGKARLCSSVEELTRQKVWITLNVNRGSWKFNIQFGPPWLSNDNNSVQLLGKIPRGIIDGQIQQAILSRAGVIGLSNYTSTLDHSTRTLTVTFTATTEQGEIPVSTDLTI